MDTIKTDKFILHFDELDRRVEFKFLNNNLRFNILTSVNDNVLFEGKIDAALLINSVEKVLENFKVILFTYSPKALMAFIKERYIYE